MLAVPRRGNPKPILSNLCPKFRPHPPRKLDCLVESLPDAADLGVSLPNLLGKVLPWDHRFILGRKAAPVQPYAHVLELGILTSLDDELGRYRDVPCHEVIEEQLVDLYPERIVFG